MPSFFSRLHSNLSLFLKCLSPSTACLASAYAKSYFSCTKIQSHIRFIHSCLRHHIVPVGFKLKHSPSDKQNRALHSATSQVLQKTSFKLMSLHLRTLEKKLAHTQRQFQSLLLRVNKQTDPASCLYIKLTILTLNNHLYQYLSNLKSKKFDKLRSKNPNHIPQASAKSDATANPSVTALTISHSHSTMTASGTGIMDCPSHISDSLPTIAFDNIPASCAATIDLSSETTDSPSATATDHTTSFELTNMHDPHNCDTGSSGINSDSIDSSPNDITHSSLKSPATSCNQAPNRPSVHTPLHHNLVQCIPTDLPLTAAERSVLSKGLKFIPKKPTTSKYDIMHNCHSFFRSLRWMGVLGHPPKRRFDQNDDLFVRLFSKPTRREPPHGVIPEVESYINKTLSEIRQLRFTPSKTSNLTPAELDALKSLQNRDDIVIKQADKGGATVVWDRELYIKETMKQLNQTDNYEKLKKSSLKTDQVKISSAINEMIKSKSLPSTARLLMNHQAKESTFYLLPKIHKPDNPGRPIVSACNCPTVHISEYVDHILQPLMKSLPTFVKDTTHALSIFETIKTNPNFQPKLLFTLDVSSLYTSIPHSDGLKALQHFLNRRQDQTPPTSAILRLAELVLTHNSFTFQDTSYAQLNGVAMGTKMGPSYACLFMGYLEEQIFSTYNKPFPELYKRYIDDCIGTTSLSRADLQDFIDFVGSFHPAIKFTYEISDISITFLDLTIDLHQGQLSTTVHYKPTDSHSYLDYHSSHNPRTKNSIPFSQFLRLRRLCSNDSDFNLKAEEMKEFFIKRNYPAEVIDKALARVKKIKRSDSLKTSDKSKTDDRPIITLPYHPSVVRVKTILLSNWKLLQSHPEVASIFHSPPLFAYKRDKNFRDLLVRSKIGKQTSNLPPGSTPCNQPKCRTCPFICSATTVSGPKTSMSIQKHFTCLTYNLVYVISCSKCSKLYIGETGRSLATRFKEHLDDVRFNRCKPVSIHFNQDGHSISDMRVKGLWIMFNGSTNDRKDRESYLIDFLGTSSPAGINMKP